MNPLDVLLFVLIITVIHYTCGDDDDFGAT